MPTFCRHNRFIHNCPICAPTSPGSGSGGTPGAFGRDPAPVVEKAPRRRTGGGRLHVRQAAQVVDDGFRTPLAPGLRSSADAQRLAVELAFATARLAELAAAAPGLYAEVATGGDVERSLELALLIALLCPLEGEPDPWEGIRAAAACAASGEALSGVDGLRFGPRGTGEAAAADRALAAYRAWVARQGSPLAAFTGDGSWTPERRFARAFERLALPGLPRAGRFDLLVCLGVLGRVSLRAGSLGLGGDDTTTVAAKRLLGIGDSLLLERRAAGLAEGVDIRLDALDLALHNWGAPEHRATLGAGVHADPQETDRVATALGLGG